MPGRRGAARYGRRACVAGSPTRVARSCWRTRSTRRPTPSSTRACTRAWAPRRPTATGTASAGTAPRPTPAVFRSVDPAWNDANLRDLAAHVTSPLFFAHIRASTGTAVQRTNCHPFRHDRWLWMHNGLINDFHGGQARPRARRRPVALPVDRGPDGLRGDLLSSRSRSGSRTTRPPRWRARSGSSRPPGAAGASSIPFQGTIATTDGERLWVFRYSSEGRSRSLYLTTDVPTLRAAVPAAGGAGAA